MRECETEMPPTESQMTATAPSAAGGSAPAETRKGDKAGARMAAGSAGGDDCVSGKDDGAKDATHVATVDQLEKEKAALAARLREAEARLEEANGEIRTKNAQVQKLYKILTVHRERSESGSEMQDAAAVQVGNLMTEKAALVAQVREAEEEKAVLETRLGEAKDQIRTKNVQVQKLYNILTVHRERSESGSEQDAAAVQVGNLMTEKAALVEQLREAKEENATLAARLGGAEDQIRTKDKQIEKMHREGMARGPEMQDEAKGTMPVRDHNEPALACVESLHVLVGMMHKIVSEHMKKRKRGSEMPDAAEGTMPVHDAAALACAESLFSLRREG